MEKLQEKIMSLLDYEQVPTSVTKRIKYLSKQLDIAEEDIRLFFKEQQPLPKGVIRNIANLFGVDVFWLTSSKL